MKQLPTRLDARPVDQQNDEHSPAAFGERQFLSHEVAGHIRRLIMAREYGPDEFIRAVPLAKRLGISPTPVREALMTLWQQGFLEQLPRRGFRVVPLADADLHDLFEIIDFLGGELAARAAPRLTTEKLRRLEQIQEQLEALDANADPGQVDTLDHDFHYVINWAADSPKYRWFLRLAYHYVPHVHFGTPDYRGRANAGHRRLLGALMARDPEVARAAMQEHLRGARQLTLEVRSRRNSGLSQNHPRDHGTIL